jgi:hypothetical protein
LAAASGQGVNVADTAKFTARRQSVVPPRRTAALIRDPPLREENVDELNQVTAARVGAART